MCNKCIAIEMEDRGIDENGDVAFDNEKIAEALKGINKDNTVDYVMAWEEGELCAECTIAFFQYLINTGMAWSLQGMYGRQATALIEARYCTRKEDK